MQKAILMAKTAAQNGEVPVGAVLAKNNKIIASAFNDPIAKNDPSAHAEINVLRQAGQAIQNYRLIDTTIYITLEPCIMCLGAMIHARVKRCVFAATEPKAGFVISHNINHCFNHQIEFQHGLMAPESSLILQSFFKGKRK